MFDHITSNTALVLPVQRLAALCRRRGVKVLIDGAHALGSVELDVRAIGMPRVLGSCVMLYVVCRVAC